MQKHKNMSSAVKGYGCLTIINHERSGRRIHLSNDIWREPGCPSYLKISLKSKQMFVMASEDYGIAVKFDRSMEFEEVVKNYTGKIVLYTTETVRRLTSDWQIEFGANCCYTGGTFKKCIISDIPAIVISIVDDLEVEKEISKDDNTECDKTEETDSIE